MEDEDTSRLVEDLQTGETTMTKPGEVVTLKTNPDLSVTETVRSESGDVISQKTLDKQDQAEVNLAHGDKSPILNTPKVK